MTVDSIANALREAGHTVRPQGRSMGGSFCPHCGQSSERSNKLSIWEGLGGKARWSCLACGKGGDLADMIAALRGIPLKAALLEVKGLQQISAPALRSTEPAREIDEAVRREVLCALRERTSQVRGAGAQYLMDRAISADVIEAAVEAGSLRFLPSDPAQARKALFDAAGSPERLHAAGFWGGKHPEWPALAFRPVLSFAGDTSLEARQIGTRSGPKVIRMGRLSKPVVLPGKHARTYVVEGIIDAMSLREFGAKGTVMALPGAVSWRAQWFVNAHKAYNTHFVLALDNDDAGRTMTRAIAAVLDKEGVPYEVKLPKAKDWNDELVASLQAVVV